MLAAATGKARLSMVNSVCQPNTIREWSQIPLRINVDNFIGYLCLFLQQIQALVFLLGTDD